MITLPILLFLLLALGFWLLVDSKYALHWRILCVVGFFSFGVVFWQNVSTFLGWPSDGKLIYDIPVTVYSVVIEEPNESSKGGIYATVGQPPMTYKKIMLNMFGYPIQERTPRLYQFPYDRKMHEEIEKEIMSRLGKGQRGVRGMFKSNKGKKGKGKGKGQDSNGKNGKSDGSQSHESEPNFFHNLVPREEHNKNAPPQPTQNRPKFII